jgi:hypothetical protein
MQPTTSDSIRLSRFTISRWSRISPRGAENGDRGIEGIDELGGVGHPQRHRCFGEQGHRGDVVTASLESGDAVPGVGQQG